MDMIDATREHFGYGHGVLDGYENSEAAGDNFLNGDGCGCGHGFSDEGDGEIDNYLDEAELWI